MKFELERLTEGPKYVRGRLTTEVKVAVGSPASFVATDVESDSHGGNACVGAAMRGGEGDRNEVCQSSWWLEGSGEVERERGKLLQEESEKERGGNQRRNDRKEIVKKAEGREAVWARTG